MWSQLYTPTHRTCRKTSSHTSPNTREHGGAVASWLTVWFLGTSRCRKDVCVQLSTTWCIDRTQAMWEGEVWGCIVLTGLVSYSPSVWLCVQQLTLSSSEHRQQETVAPHCFFQLLPSSSSSSSLAPSSSSPSPSSSTSMLHPFTALPPLVAGLLKPTSPYVIGMWIGGCLSRGNGIS